MCCVLTLSICLTFVIHSSARRRRQGFLSLTAPSFFSCPSVSTDKSSPAGLRHHEEFIKSWPTHMAISFDGHHSWVQQEKVGDICSLHHAEVIRSNVTTALALGRARSDDIPLRPVLFSLCPFFEVQQKLSMCWWNILNLICAAMSLFFSYFIWCRWCHYIICVGVR